jgi:16S rRNA processing protein RimM
MSADLVAIARIGRAHGVRGDLKVWPFDADSETLFHVDSVKIGPEGGEVVDYALTRCRVAPGERGLLLSLREVGSREQAQALLDAILYVRPEQLLEVEEDTWYHRDLLGLPVQTATEDLGVLEEILDNGAHDTLVVRDHARGVEVQIPFIDGMVEVEEGVRIVVTPPEGLLEATRARLRER